MIASVTQERLIRMAESSFVRSEIRKKLQCKLQDIKVDCERRLVWRTSEETSLQQLSCCAIARANLQCYFAKTCGGLHELR